MAMSLIAIVKDILTSQVGEKLTLDQLTTLAENHHAYSGRSKRAALRNQIRRIVLEDKEVERERRGSCIYFGIKLGRIELGGKFDLSE